MPPWALGGSGSSYSHCWIPAPSALPVRQESTAVPYENSFLKAKCQNGNLTSPVKEEEVPLRALPCAQSVGDRH